MEEIRDKIYLIRSLQIMLDRDLAELYGVKPIRLREQVKRNLERFPEDFMFQLTQYEAEIMVSQNAIPSKQHLGGFLPYAFTEQGVAMLSSVLRSKKSVEVNIKIMRAFIAMRKILAENAEIFLRLSNVERRQLEHDEKFEQIFSAIENKTITKKQGIFFDGQIFDAYKFVSDLIRSAEKSINLIDNYIDDSVLTLLTKRKSNVKATIYTTTNKQIKLDLEKHNSQFNEIIIKEFNKSHDRFLIIDNKDFYHIGASLKDLGKKWFAFSRLDKDIVELFERLK